MADRIIRDIKEKQPRAGLFLTPGSYFGKES
jgi:hypothetical protein